MGARALWAFRLRSLFVAAAVSLGIASLTVIVASVDGAQQMAREITRFFGPDAAFVLGGDIFNKPVGQRVLTLSLRDARRLRESLPDAVTVTPMRAKRNVKAKTDGRNMDLQVVVGSAANYARSWDWPLAQGRDISRRDMDLAARVALIGRTVEEKLFPQRNPVGKSLLIQDIPFRVVGVLEERGFTGGGGRSIDERVVVPLSTLTRRFNMNRKHYRALRVRFASAEHVQASTENLRGFLRHLHGLQQGEPDDFTILTADEVLKFVSMLKGGLVLFLGLTAACAMLAGGFVLANLFYLSVAERSAEIGLKRALGARSGAIMTQFLAEAAALTLAGALLGMVLGVGLAQVLARLDVLQIAFSWKIFALSVLASLAIGVGFGLKPARRAAALDPIQALRGDA
jgi:putative ABC transport system permease protein